MTATTIQDLRLLICEDDYLLALDMAQQLTALGATVTGFASSLDDVRRWVSDGLGETNAAIADVGLTDGESYEGIRLLRQAGLAVVVCSGYMAQDLPSDVTDVPWLGKPARAEDIARALCKALDARREATSVE